MTHIRTSFLRSSQEPPRVLFLDEDCELWLLMILKGPLELLLLAWLGCSMEEEAEDRCHWLIRDVTLFLFMFL